MKHRDIIVLIVIIGITQILGYFLLPAKNNLPFLSNVLFVVSSVLIISSRRFFLKKNEFFSNALNYFLLSGTILGAIGITPFSLYLYNAVSHGLMKAGSDSFTISMLVSFVIYQLIVLYHIVLGKMQKAISVKQTVLLELLSLLIWVVLTTIVSMAEVAIGYVILNLLY